MNRTKNLYKQRRFDHSLVAQILNHPINDSARNFTFFQRIIWDAYGQLVRWIYMLGKIFQKFAVHGETFRCRIVAFNVAHKISFTCWCFHVSDWFWIHLFERSFFSPFKLLVFKFCLMIHAKQTHIWFLSFNE